MSSYRSFVYCTNCGSNHMQVIPSGQKVSDVACDNCKIASLKPSAKSPKDYGYEKSDYGNWWKK